MSEQKHLPPEALDEWKRAACAEIGLDADEIDIPLVLDLARDVAHGVARPAAPLAAFLAGLAAGRSEDPAAARDAIAKLTALSAGWES